MRHDAPVVFGPWVFDNADILGLSDEHSGIESQIRALRARQREVEAKIGAARLALVPRVQEQSLQTVKDLLTQYLDHVAEDPKASGTLTSGGFRLTYHSQNPQRPDSNPWMNVSPDSQIEWYDENESPKVQRLAPYVPWEDVRDFLTEKGVVAQVWNSGSSTVGFSMVLSMRDGKATIGVDPSLSELR